MATLMNSGGTSSRKSACACRKLSQRGWFSSTMDTSTRSSIGSFLPFICFKMAWPTASSGAGSAS